MAGNAIFGPASPKQAMMMSNQAQILVIGGAAGCVDKDTEFLSESGWKKISEYQTGDKVLQFNPDNNESIFVEPVDYIKLP